LVSSAIALLFYLSNPFTVTNLDGVKETFWPLGIPYVEPGARLIDYPNRDITERLKIGGDVVTGLIPGDFTVTYNGDDEAGNVAEQKTRIVHVMIDVLPAITAPIITVPDTVWHVEFNNPILKDTEAHAFDYYNVDISDRIVLTGVDTSVRGSYVCSYGCTDHYGNVAIVKTRKVVVEDTQYPVIMMLGDAITTIKVGSGYTDVGVTVIDNWRDITSRVRTRTNIVDKEGYYYVYYSVADEVYHTTVATRRVIVVK
jgi:hypothetical protein